MSNAQVPVPLGWSKEKAWTYLRREGSVVARLANAVPKVREYAACLAGIDNSNTYSDKPLMKVRRRSDARQGKSCIEVGRMHSRTQDYTNT